MVTISSGLATPIFQTVLKAPKRQELNHVASSLQVRGKGGLSTLSSSAEALPLG